MWFGWRRWEGLGEKERGCLKGLRERSEANLLPEVIYLVAVDPPAKSLTFWGGLVGNHLIS